MVKRLSAGLCTILILCVRFYQYFISPLFPPACRFYPTCSAYAVEAIQRHGALLGSFYAVRRILRCHPWSSGGVDPVPPVRNNDTPYRSR